MAKQRIKRANVTLRDIAEAANVSMMTVSNVIHGRSNTIGEETRKRVELQIKKLNYRPNTSARSLRVSSSQSIGMVVSDADPAFLSDPFISQLVSGMSNYLSSVDHSLDIQGVVPQQFEQANVLRKAGKDALCAILCGPSRLRKQHVDYLKKLGQPTVLFQEPIEIRGHDIAIIRQDDEGGGHKIGSHLIEKKVQRIVFLKPASDWPAIEQREKGLRKAIQESNSSVSLELVVASTEGYEDSKIATKLLLEKNQPGAIVAATDSMAIAAMHACNEKGLNIPKSVRVIGFNGFEAWRYATPTLTTVRSPAYEMGHRAGEVLLKRLQTGSFERKNILFPTELVPGSST